MKLTLYIIYTIFFIAMGCGIYIGFQTADGLVDNNYYHNSTNYFQTKAHEEKLGIVINKPDTLTIGTNTFTVAVTSHGTPFEQGNISLLLGNVSTNNNDTTLTMQETAPGIYQTTISIPYKGKWFTRLELYHRQQLITTKQWFFSVQLSPHLQ